MTSWTPHHVSGHTCIEEWEGGMEGEKVRSAKPQTLPKKEQKHARTKTYLPVLCILPKLRQDGGLAADKLVAERKEVINHQRLVHVPNPVNIDAVLVVPKRKPWYHESSELRTSA